MRGQERYKNKKRSVTARLPTFLSVRDEIRTHTSQRPLPPQSSVSTNSTTRTYGISSLILVPRTGLEPACLSTHAPETCASTNSATWAKGFQHFKERENETRTRDPNLGKVMLYQLSYFRICNHCFSIAVAKVGIFLISASIRNTFFSRKCALCFWQTTNVLIINSFYRDNLRRKTA